MNFYYNVFKRRVTLVSVRMDLVKWVQHVFKCNAFEEKNECFINTLHLNTDTSPFVYQDIFKSGRSPDYLLHIGTSIICAEGKKCSFTHRRWDTFFTGFSSPNFQRRSEKKERDRDDYLFPIIATWLSVLLLKMFIKSNL